MDTQTNEMHEIVTVSRVLYLIDGTDAQYEAASEYLSGIYSNCSQEDLLSIMKCERDKLTGGK